MYKARFAEKSHLPVNGKSGCSSTFISLQARNLRLPILRNFDKEALMDYDELLHNLVKHLNKKYTSCSDLSHGKFFSESPKEDLIRLKDIPQKAAEIRKKVG